MDPVTTKVGGAVGISGLKKLGELVQDYYQDRRMQSRVNDGQDLTRAGTLKALIQQALQRLVGKPNRLPERLRDSDIGTWLLQEDFLDPFVWLVVATGDGYAKDGGLAREFLAQQYAKVTGENEQEADGTINYVASFVVGRLQLSVKRKAEYQLALQRLLAAGFQEYFQAELRPNPSAFDIFRLQNLAQVLIAAGKATWRIPDFLAPFTLEAYQFDKESEPIPVDPNQLAFEIQEKTRIVLFGEGGIGKTTYLLQLASECLSSKRACIPIYVDAAAWAYSGREILDFVANVPEAKIQNFSVTDLTWFAKRARIVLMVNGWNEIPADRKFHFQSLLTSLQATAPNMPLVIVSRTSNDSGNLPEPREIAVRGITWSGQKEIILKELEQHRALELLEKMERDIRLLRAAKSPLILRGLIAQAKKGLVSSSVIFDLLGAVVSELEEHVAYKPILASEPLFGFQDIYLEELACAMNNQRTVRISEREALAAFASGFIRIQSMLGSTASLPKVLETLKNHHLVQVQDGQVKFAHQRFQEFYSASRLVDICSNIEEPVSLLMHAANEPYWAEALSLVAEKLQSTENMGKQKQKLVRAALSVDLSYACELAGLCSLTSDDAPELHKELIFKINELSMSPLLDVQHLSLLCKVSSRFLEFANGLWEILENNEQQNRLHFYQMHGTSIALKQLGTDASDRISKWEPRYQAEFMHEVASNPENYDFLMHVAARSPEQHVQQAALYGLLWSYPTSSAVIQIWSHAPVEVAISQTIMSLVAHAYEQGIENAAIRERLNSLVKSGISENERLHLAIEFPGVVDDIPLDYVFEALAKEYRISADDSIVKVARRYALERLRELAATLCLGNAPVPNWVAEVLLELSSAEKTAVFQEALQLIEDGKIDYFRPPIIGPLAAKEQISETVSACLDYLATPRAARTEEESNKFGNHERLLAHVHGDLLFDVIIEKGLDATYEASEELLNLVWQRIDREENPYGQQRLWKPSSEQLQKLLQTFSIKSESSDNPHVDVPILLARIASEVAPADNASTLITALDKYLDALSAHKAVMEQWLQRRDGPQPHAPALGSYVISALANWGFAALPALKERYMHQEASDIIPPAIARITNSLWFSLRRGAASTLAGCIAEGQRRQQMNVAMCQPTVEYQQVTDDVVKLMVQQLDMKMAKALEEKEPRAANQLKYRVGSDARYIAAIPSSNVIAPLSFALSSGLLDSWRLVNVLQGLLLNGWKFSDRGVVKILEDQFYKESQNSGHQEKQLLTQFCQLIFSVESLDLLEKTVEHYLQEWRKFDHPNQIVQKISESHMSHGWDVLLKAYELFVQKGLDIDQFGLAIGKALLPKHIPSLISQIKNGRFFTWFRTRWTQENIASYIARVVIDRPEDSKKIRESVQNKAFELGDDFEYEILKALGEEEQVIMQFGLTAVDAGRVNNENTPAYRALMGLLAFEKPISTNQYEVIPKSCNVLRKELYKRAVAPGLPAEGAQKILASLECKRREGGRPDDEPRHPMPTQGTTWTDALVHSRF